MLREFPNVRDKRIAGSSVEAVAAVPFVMEGRASGGIAFSFGKPTRFDGATRAFLETFALQCAQALERTRLFDDERRARIENERLFEAEREARRLRDDFLSIAGHELRTPLSTMHLQLESLRRHAISGALADMPGVLVERLDKAVRNVDRLKQLIVSLLDVSKIVAGRLAIDREPFDLRELADEVIERFADAGSAIELVAAAPVAGNWDRGRLDQVITNLIDNAIKYGEGNPVSILIESRDDHARIAVRDQGLGIAADAQERIFGRFERAVSSRHYGGLGLGLWICRQLVEAHGGTIGVASTPGSGTTFVVDIPFGAAPVAS
jgi:signal transduction histidine kinase